MKKPPPVSPPGALVLRGFLLTSLLWFAVPWLWSLGTIDGHACYHLTPAAAWADLRSIRDRLAAGDDRTMHRLFPEGRLFAHSFYGFTLINLAAGNPQDADFRRQALAELARLIPLTEALAAEAPFDQCRSLTPRGGVIAAGHANLLRAGYAILGGTDPAILAAYHAQSEILFAAFASSGVANLESYPNQIWPVDNLGALESLRLHDVLFHTTYASAATRWADWMSAHVDSATGLMNMQIDGSGAILDGPRGCGLSWTLAFLPNLAPDLAHKQYAIYREAFFGHPLGTTGIREFPAGRAGTFVDSDTGPILFGLGTAATGFGIAAAKANHDPENLTGLLRALEICSFPAYSTNLSHARFFGQVLLADEIALWGKTLTRWDAPSSVLAPEPAPFPPIPLKNYWLVPLLLALFTLLIAWLLLRAIRRIWRCRQQWPRPLPRLHAIFFALSLLTLPAFLLVPPFHWVCAFLLLAIVEILSTRIFPLPAGVTSPAGSPPAP